MTGNIRSNRRFLAAQIVAFVAGLALTIPTEVMKFRAAAGTKLGLWAWFFWLDHDTTFAFVLLLIAPAFWFVRRLPSWLRIRERDGSAPLDHGRSRPSGSERTTTKAARDAPVGRSIDVSAWIMAAACALASIVASAWIASLDVEVEKEQPPMHFGDLPPDIHDEYSYLFQARTFLAGRLSFPSSARMPELFDQMHVLNEGRFASRYFPGVGLWLAPFVAMGHPYWGEWLAFAMSAFFIFWAARELAGNGVGLLAGMLTALSPGIGLFSNLLLSHGPTMAGLSFFLYFFLRLMRTGRLLDALWAGCGLSFAMLCRPLTAAGFALPFGLWIAWWLFRPTMSGPTVPSPPVPNPTVPGQRLRALGGLALPLLLGFGVLFVYNRAVTGNGFISPYEVYTNIYTPRHVYGFNNVVRGERKLGPKVLENYDLWAENLTPKLAAKNVEKRVAASAKWTLGPVPLAMGVIVFVLAALWQVDWRWRLVAASVLSLHAVYIPYWLSGIMDWHYVFETGPLLLMIFAATSQLLVNYWKESKRVLMPAWWAALVASAVVTNWVPFDPFWLSRVDYGVQELSFARVKYEKVQRLIDRFVTKRPALLLIEPDPADRHIDYVVNDPGLTAPVIRGRFQPKKTDLALVKAAFPDRTLYLYRVQAGEVVQLSP